MQEKIASFLEIAGIRVSWFLDPHAEVTLNIRNEPLPPLLKKEPVFDSEQTWALFRSEGKLVLQNAGLHTNLKPGRVLFLAPDLKSGDLYLGDDSPQDVDPLGYPLNQVLWILLLSQRRGVLFHACGMDDDGKGYLFLGNSGDGKSTTAKLWSDQGMAVLNDDRIIVREKNGELWMYGTPWHGDFKRHSCRGLPVRKLFFLNHGEKNSARPKSGAEAVSMLLTRSFSPFWDHQGMTLTIELCRRLAGQIPCYELAFLPDPGMIDFVRKLQPQKILES